MTTKVLLLLSLLTGLLLSCGDNKSTQSEATGEKMSVDQRLAKAREAKATKRDLKATGQLPKEEKATPADYQAPVIKTLKGPNGEVVHTGERGAPFYINKNGNKTYLSSNR